MSVDIKVGRQKPLPRSQRPELESSVNIKGKRENLMIFP